jgi:hypothetical protein
VAPAGTETRSETPAFVPHAGGAHAAEEKAPAAAPAVAAAGALSVVEGLTGAACSPEDGLAALTPQIAGLLAGPVPVDLHALTRGADRFFAQLEGLGRELAAWALSERVAPWLAAAAVGAAAYELARRPKQPGAGDETAPGGAARGAWPSQAPAFPTGGEP